nr:ATP-binding protein [Corallococcus sicarius]
MINLVRAGVSGDSEYGPFQGTLSFEAGLQVITGKNGYGKSLSVSAVAWCLGLEPMFGLQRNDPSIFPEGARSQFLLESGKPSKVIHSHAFVEMSFGNERAIVRRAITGGVPGRVEVEFPASGVRRTLIAGSMADSAGGFQAALFKWAGLPVADVMTPTGATASLYIENLAPLFFLEQREGWSELQNLQIVRYRQLEVGEAAIEYILGLNHRLTQRRVRQSAELGQRRVKDELAAWSDRVKQLAAEYGWDADIPTRGDVLEWARRYREFKLNDYFAQSFGWTFKAEHERLTSLAGQLQKRLNSTTELKASDAAAAEASSKVINLKHAIHEKQQQIETLRTQRSAQTEVLEATKARIQSAEDLTRLKRENIGVLDTAECPTCHSLISPEKFDLHEQAASTVGAYIAASRRDADALRSALNDAAVTLQKLTNEIREMEQTYASSIRFLKLMNDAGTPAAEGVAELAARILNTERELDRARSLANRLSDLQAELEQWCARVLSTDPAKNERSEIERENRVVSEFTSTFKSLLLDLGHSEAVHVIDDVHLDDRYVPMAGQRRLRSLGSASDQPRLILAYCWALLEVALKSGGNHPGFLLADEPLQQNPDHEHRESWCDFLAAQAQRQTGQVIILTSLKPDEIKKLRGKGVAITELREQHLLKLVDRE